MIGRVFGMLDMAVVGVPVLAFCLWQLVSVNREIARDRDDSPERASPESSGHPVGEHREDDR